MSTAVYCIPVRTMFRQYRLPPLQQRLAAEPGASLFITAQLCKRHGTCDGISLQPLFIVTTTCLTAPKQPPLTSGINEYSDSDHNPKLCAAKVIHPRTRGRLRRPGTFVQS